MQHLRQAFQAEDTSHEAFNYGTQARSVVDRQIEA